MYCAIYKSLREQDTYLYVAERDDFSRVPEALLKLLGTPVHIMDLELTAERKLAREDVREVMRSLLQQGWYLQLPLRQDSLAEH